MIDIDGIRSIIDTYERYGWLLRRALLTPASNAQITDKNSLFSDIPVLPSDIDAAWFSRPPAAGDISWELRYLGEPPFALLIKTDEKSPYFEDSLKSVEARLTDTIGSKRGA